MRVQHLVSVEGWASQIGLPLNHEGGGFYIADPVPAASAATPTNAAEQYVDGDAWFTGDWIE